jgi:hypothetical protein
MNQKSTKSTVQTTGTYPIGKEKEKNRERKKIIKHKTRIPCLRHTRHVKPPKTSEPKREGKKKGGCTTT